MILRDTMMDDTMGNNQALNSSLQLCNESFVKNLHNYNRSVAIETLRRYLQK